MQKNFTLKRIVCLLAALCLAAGLVGCVDMPASSSEESSLPTILVGSDVYPPFNYIGEDGAPTGIDVELAKEAFRRMGYRAEFTIIDWERKTQLLETGDIDCVWGSFTINGREDDYRWAGPYMASRQVVAVMPGSDIETIADLEGRTLDFVDEKAFLGTLAAHVDGGVPVITMDCGELNDRKVGEMFYFLELCCGVSAYILDVNPFNQPGVEFYKRNMFKLLGKPGYESK